MTFDLQGMLRQIKERDSKDHWKLALTGICPRCDNAKGHRYVDSHNTGEIEWIPCAFCLSEAEIEERMSE